MISCEYYHSTAMASRGGRVGIPVVLVVLLVAIIAPPAVAERLPNQTFDDPTITNADQFGSAIAIDGQHVLVGARGDDTSGENVGQAHLFHATTGALWQTFNDPVLTPTNQSLFGHSVALVGNQAVIGAPHDSSGPGTGQAHLFDATTGALLRTFTDPTITQFDQFGWAVALNGNLLAVSAPGDDTRGSHVGQVHLFDVAAGNLLQTFDDPTPLGSDNFGWSVAVDGNFVLVGAPSDGTAGKHVGQAHLFDAVTGSLIRTFDDPSVTSEDGFGYAVAIRGNQLLISAWGDDTEGLNVGQVHLFDALSGTLLRTFNDPMPTGGDMFGYSIAIDGDNVVVGENRDFANADGSGHAHRFSVAGELIETFDSPMGDLSDGFGTRVAMDALRVSIAAPGSDAAGSGVGHVHMYLVPEPCPLSLSVGASLFFLIWRRSTTQAIENNMDERST